MTAKAIIKEIMDNRGMTNATLAKKLGITQAAVWARLDPKKSNNMTVGKVNEMLKPMYCEVIIRDPLTGQEWTVDE